MIFPYGSFYVKIVPYQRKDPQVLLKIENIKLNPDQGVAALTSEAARLLKIREKDILSLRPLRRSIDAREEVFLVYTIEVSVKNETEVLKLCRSKRVSLIQRSTGYLLPPAMSASETPPVVVGAGPAGLFAALVLAKAGLKPILLERGCAVEYSGYLYGRDGNNQHSRIADIGQICVESAERLRKKTQKR